MTKPKILSTRPLFPAARAVLDQHFEVDYWTPPERITREELLKRVADKEGLVCLLTEKVDEELLAARAEIADCGDGFGGLRQYRCSGVHAA